MGYETLNEFIKNEKNPERYCLDFEYSNSQYMALNPIERYLVYKSTGIKVDKKGQSLSIVQKYCLNNLNNYGNIPDCDGSDGRNTLILDIYKKLWNWNKGYYAFGEISMATFKGIFGGDTMNSMQTVFNDILKNSLNKTDNNIFDDYKKGKYSFMDSLGIYCNFPEKFMLELEKEPDFIQFANLYHTIGNMVLVPRLFNRGRYGKTFDFWDSSLVWLKKDGFSYNNEQIFDKNNFIKYINYFYLWDYVECKNSAYRIKPLFDSHNNVESGNVNNTIPWSNLITIQDTKQFLSNACENIVHRGKFMTILLCLIASSNLEILNIGKRFFDYIQGNEFLNYAHKDPYNKVKDKLLELIDTVEDKDNKDYQLIYEGINSLCNLDNNNGNEVNNN